MKNILTFLLLILTTSFVGISTADYETKHQEYSAVAVVDTYLNAIISGNTDVAIDNLGGSMLDNRRARLEDPNYSNFLLNYYANAYYEIIGSNVINTSDIAIDASIIFSEDEPATINRFILRKDINGSYRIISER